MVSICQSVVVTRQFRLFAILSILSNTRRQGHVCLFSHQKCAREQTSYSRSISLGAVVAALCCLWCQLPGPWVSLFFSEAGASVNDGIAMISSCSAVTVAAHLTQSPPTLYRCCTCVYVVHDQPRVPDCRRQRDTEAPRHAQVPKAGM